MNNAKPEITIVIPNWNGRRWLPDCLDALSRQSFKDAGIIIVDNGSSDGSVAWVKEHHPYVQVMELGRNTGFAYAVNAGIKASTSPLVALLNTDTCAEPAWLEQLHTTMKTAADDIGAVCGKMLKREQPDRVENAGDLLSWQGAAEKRGYGDQAGVWDQASEVFSCCAGAALYRRTFLEKAGLFDDAFFAYLEDIDLGLRGRLMGYRFLYEPSARILHQGHGSELPSSTYVRLTTANRLRLFIKNIPGTLLLRRLPSILYGQWYFLVCNRKPWASALGYLDVLRSLPTLFKQRREIRQLTVIPSPDIVTILSDRMQQPGLCRALIDRLKRKPAT